MIILLRLLACAWVTLNILSPFQAAHGQSLYDVIVSLSDRQRVVNQQRQVAVYLANENNATTYDTNITGGIAGALVGQMPADEPINWVGVGTAPTPTAVEGIGVGEKIALLNQAISEFNRLRHAYINTSVAELQGSTTVGNITLFEKWNFDPLPRATPENFSEVITLLGQKVRSLQILLWPAAFNAGHFGSTHDAEEIVALDENGENPHVQRYLNGNQVDSVTWKPSQIGPDIANSIVEDPLINVVPKCDSTLRVEGTYEERGSGFEEIPELLKSQTIRLSGHYPREAIVSATAPGADGVQIGGTVYILRRSAWNELVATGVEARYSKSDAAYHIEGSAATGSIPLMADPPGATISGHWVTKWWEEGYLDQTFVEDGYQYKDTWVLWEGTPGFSDAYNNSYEKKWRIGCTFYTVFIPAFTRGLDATGMAQKLESSSAMLAYNSADGKLLLHPRPGHLFGIQLGPDLKGLGNGYISGISLNSDWYYGYDHYVYGGSTSYYGWYFGNWNTMMARFDSSYSLRLAGSCSDYHVVYENDRLGRSQSLPEDGMGWPYTDMYNYAHYDTDTLYQAWDSPRLKQVAGRDLVAEIEYNSSHYGGYTVRVYRRPTGSSQPTPGQALSTSGMTLIRTWTFSHPGAGTTAHPTDAEKLLVTGIGNEKYEIQANHILPNQGRGYVDWYGGAYGYVPWWLTDEGTWSWTLKLSQDTTEKLRKEIEVDTWIAAGNYSESEVTLREFVDGQETSSLYSIWLDPFSDQLPWDWEITSAGKSITGAAAFDYDDPASGYGRLPSSVSITYDGIQPDVDYTWDAQGLLSSINQGPWSTSGAASGDTYALTHKFNGTTYSSTWIEILDGGNKVKTYSAPDGNAGSKSHASVAWSEVEYGSASNGLPGLPFIVKNADGTGATYGWNASSDGSYVLTLEDGLLSGSSVSRGTKLIRNVNSRGHPTQTESFVINGGTVKTGGAVFANMTAWGIPKKSTDYRTGLDSTWNFDSNLSRLSSHTGSFGIASNFSTYDVLGRPGTVSTNGISSANTYTAFSTSATITGGATGSIVETRDTLGRLTSSNTTWNSVTDNLAVTPNTSPVAITRTQSLLGTYNSTVRKDDGTVATTSGPTLPFGGTEGTVLAVEDGLLRTKSELGDQSNAYRTTWTDAWGRVRKTETPSTAPSGTDETNFIYSDPDSSIKRVRVTQASGRILITESDPYNASGMIRRSGIDVNGNGSLGTSDRYVESVTTVSGGTLVTTLSLTEDTGLREILRTAWTPSGGQTVTTINGSEETITRTPNYSAKTITTTSNKGWSKTETFNNLGLTTNSTLSGTSVPTAALTPVWRDDGSLSGVTFTAGGDTHSASFKNDGTLATLTAPGRGNILGGHSIGDGSETLTVDGVTQSWSLDGTSYAIHGSDVLARTETITPSGSGFKLSTSPAGGAATQVHTAAAGAPTSKSYAFGPGEGRIYHSGGLLQSITLARGGSIAFGYSNDGAKDLTSATWPTVPSGPFTIPGIVQGYGYDRAGRVDEIGDNSGVRGLSHQNGRLVETTWTSGPLKGYRIQRGHDALGRETGFALFRDNSPIHSAAQAPNGVSGEISALSCGDLVIQIGRNAARHITGFQWSHPGDNTIPTINQNWTRGIAGRILTAGSDIPGAPTFNYTSFDLRGRRLNCQTTGGEWTYQYTNGQLTSAVHPTLGSFTYQFDPIGRRIENSNNSSDLLNRTLSWNHNQNKTLKVQAHPAARVWVNGNEIQNFDGTHSFTIPPPGTSGGWVPWNTLAILEGQGDPGANPDAKSEQSGAIWVPPTQESFTYDAAGNRQSSALWDYGWDAKNQLVRARTKHCTATPETAAAPLGYDITYAYDAEGRRFSKKVVRYQNGIVSGQKHITYLHHGNDLIYERHQLPSGLTLSERRYLWGPDIAGGNAGGAGGLLLIRETQGNETTDLYPLYDGTGHLIALATLIEKVPTVVAQYSYGPFGEKISAKGPRALSNPIRYANKYFDEETGLYYFGKRYLDPITGQWLSREPLGESESLNLYSYADNDPINKIDVLGLKSKWVTDPNNPIKELPDGSKIINLVWLVDKWFGDDYLDYSKTDTRAFGTNYWDHYLWSKRADGSWGASAGNQTMLDVAEILEEKHHFSTHAKIGTVAMGGYSALLAAPVAAVTAPAFASAASEASLAVGVRGMTYATQYSGVLARIGAVGTGGLVYSGLHDPDSVGMMLSTPIPADDIAGGLRGFGLLAQDARAAGSAAWQWAKPSTGNALESYLYRSGGLSYAVPPGTGPYNQVAGHHVHAKKAFEGASGYNFRHAFSVSSETMSKYGVRHADITGAQFRLFREFSQSGAPNTLTHHSRIAYQAMVGAGMPPNIAKQLVLESQSRLIQAGVVEPTLIPWGTH